jgi:glucan phosphorylase
MLDITPHDIGQRIASFLTESLSTQAKNASEEQLYRASAWVVREILSEKHRKFSANALSHAKKQVHYISMEVFAGALT